MVTGINEPKNEDSASRRSRDKIEVMALIRTIFADCPEPTLVHRIGKYSADKIRPLKVHFDSNTTAKNILRQKNKLGPKNKIFSDQTPGQRRYFNEVKDELKVRQAGGEEHLIIKYIKGIPTITKEVPKNSN